MDQGARIRYERFASTSHDGIRILVAGAGTLEGLVVAQAHPRAERVVAVDLSHASLRILKRRESWARLARPLRRLPKIQLVRADLREWEPAQDFDYILASNVLHHVEDPAALLARLSKWLKPDGWMRVVTYPHSSRLWLRETSRWLRAQGLSRDTPSLVHGAREAITRLPSDHPFRSCFESQPEVRTNAGLVDAFFHVCENPLTPLQWGDACAQAGLVLAAEDQTETSRSDFLTELFPSTRALNSWEKLQILDDLLELCANPVFWLRKTKEVEKIRNFTTIEPLFGKSVDPSSERDQTQIQMKIYLERASRMLAQVGISREEAHRILKEKVGPRVAVDGRVLPGLALVDYDWADLHLEIPASPGEVT